MWGIQSWPGLDGNFIIYHSNINSFFQPVLYYLIILEVRVTDLGVKHLVKNCKEITDLNLSGCKVLWSIFSGGWYLFTLFGLFHLICTMYLLFVWGALIFLRIGHVAVHMVFLLNHILFLTSCVWMTSCLSEHLFHCFSNEVRKSSSCKLKHIVHVFL